jgi:hypothetical protein
MMPPDPGVGWLLPDQEFAVPEYRKTKTAGVYVRHQSRCAAGSDETARCRCQPSFRGRRWDPGQRAMVWSDTFKARGEVLTWLAANVKGADALAEREAAGPSFSSLADEWLDGVRSGAVGRRRGRSGIGYFPHHLAGLRAIPSIRPRSGVRRSTRFGDR